MVNREKINTLALVCVAAAASLIAASAIYRLHRRRRRIATSRRRCSEFDEKPQNRFKRVLADNSYSPFKHYKRMGKEKEISLRVHPYEEEITSLMENLSTPVEFVSNREQLVMDDSYVWINTEEKLEMLASLLTKEKAFAVDTEQHSLRSFLGFTALMQISTEKEDFLLDTISLHDEMGILRPVFADPSVCKVFHGADNDVLWLQRDFHIYVVNMFDTAKACEILSKPQKSLAYLLETYCGISTDKSFQREDWRLRPFSAEMIQYARTDAHYLLYIADCLSSELRKENIAGPDDKLHLFFEATRRSNMVCMQLYAKEIESTPGASAAASLYSRMHVQEYTALKSSEIKEILWRLCAWRELMARIHDESLRYILSDQAIVALATKVPREPTEIFQIIQQADLSTESSNIAAALPTPSHIVSFHMDEICFLLQEVGVNMSDVLTRYLQRHLDPTGCCSVSIYNYALLSEFSLKQTDTLFLKQNGGKFSTPVGKKASRELFVQKFSCKSPVYHNCRIYANDGRLLCYCDRRKLEWYVQRNLAKIVEDEPPAIMLLFEPKGRPEDEDNDFYIQSKKNICVGCGEKNHYLRYRIIPSCYRMHFPEHLKSHRSHDIVLLCVDCHEIAHSAAEKYKRQIAAEFGIPLFVRKIVNTGESKVINLSESSGGVEDTGVSPLQLRTAAMALLRHGSSMPPKRRDELTQIVKAYFGGREISSEDLEMALLVGMSPHEIRRLEKKKGLNLRRYRDSSFHVFRSSSVQTSGYNSNLNNTASNSKEPSEDGEINEIDDGQRSTSMSDMDVDPLHRADEDTSFIDDNDQRSDGVETMNKETNLFLDHDNIHTIPSDKTDGDQSSSSHQVLSSKSAKKLSLLGHGPHGKQVVEHLLKNYGEDGICQFCQRWRQVFVEAVHPRFLPAGWDIKHSGRRDFGDYSVYNPAKKVSEAASTSDRIPDSVTHGC